MHKPIIYFPLLALLTGCTPMPLTSQLVLMAANNKADTSATAEPTTASVPFSVPCRNVTNNKADFNSIVANVYAESVKQNSGQPPNSIEPSDIANPNINALEGLSDEIIQKRTGLSHDELMQAATLLASGQFRSDLGNIVVLIIATIPEMAHALPQSAARLANTIDDLKTKNVLGSFQHCLADIKTKQACSELQDIYTEPSLKLSRGTLVQLLDNRSFRLALVVYARSNGVNIDYRDLDFVKEQLGKPSLDINALVQAGQLQLEKKYKIDEAKAKIDSLKAACNAP